MSAGLKVVTERRATDGTRKLLVKLRDGASVETVLIPNVTRGKSDLPSPVSDPDPGQDADAAAIDDEDEMAPPRAGEPIRVTQCISTQECQSKLPKNTGVRSLGRAGN